MSDELWTEQDDKALEYLREDSQDYRHVDRVATRALAEMRRLRAELAAIRDDAKIVADFVAGWWPGLEDAISWPDNSNDPRFLAAQRLSEHFESVDPAPGGALRP